MGRHERLLAAIYSGIEQPDDWRDAFEQLARLTRSRAAGLFIVAGSTLEFDLDAGMPEAFMRGFRTAAPADPRLHYAARRPRLSVVSDDAAALRPAIEAAGLDRIKREFDLHFTAACILPDDSGRMPALYVSRSARQGPLPGAQCQSLACVAPHFARALRLQGELQRARRYLRGCEQGDVRYLPSPCALCGDADPARQSTLPALPRQLRRVLQGIAAGQSTAEIARGMALSVNTVRTHVRRLFELSGAHRRTALLRYAADRGWLR